MAVNGSRRKKPESMALMFSPVVIILPVKPVSGGRLKIKLMLPHLQQAALPCYRGVPRLCGYLVPGQMPGCSMQIVVK